MKGRLNTVLLLVVIVLLVFLIVQPQDGVGRFQPFGESGVVLDTQTGQACNPFKARGNPAIPLCTDLVTK